MIEFNVLSIFPEMFDSFVAASICRRAIDGGLVAVIP